MQSLLKEESLKASRNINQSIKSDSSCTLNQTSKNSAFTHTKESLRNPMFTLDNDKQLIINSKNEKSSNSESQSILLKVFYPNNSSNIIKLNLNSELISDNINETTESKTNSQNVLINNNKVIGSVEDITESNKLDFSTKQYTVQENNIQNKKIKKSADNQLPIVKDIGTTEFENETMQRLNKENEKDVEEAIIFKKGEARKLQDVKIKEFKIKDDEHTKKIILSSKDQEKEEFLAEIMQRSNKKNKIDAEAPKIIKKIEGPKIQDVEIKKSNMPDNKTDEHSKKLLVHNNNSLLNSFLPQEAEAGKLTNKRDTTKTQDVDLKKFKTQKIKENEHLKKKMDFVKDQEVCKLKIKPIQQLNKKDFEEATRLKKGETTKTQDVEPNTLTKPKIKKDEESKKTLVLVKEHEVKTFEDQIMQIFPRKEERKRVVAKRINKIKATKTQCVELKQFKVAKIKDYEQSKENTKLVKNQEIDKPENEIIQKLKKKDAEISTVFKKGEVPKTQDVGVKIFNLTKIKTVEQPKNTTIIFQNQKEEKSKHEKMQRFKEKYEKDVETAKIIKKRKTTETENVAFKKFKSLEIKKDDQSKKNVVNVKDQKVEEFKNEMVQNLKKHKEKDFKVAKEINAIKPSKIRDNTLKKCETLGIQEGGQSKKPIIIIKNQEKKPFEDEIMQRSKRKEENDAEISKIRNKEKVSKTQDVKIKKIKTPEIKKDGQSTRTMICDKNQAIEEIKNKMLQKFKQKLEVFNYKTELLKEIDVAEFQDVEFEMFENKKYEQSNTTFLIDKQQEKEKLKNEIRQRLKNKQEKYVDKAKIKKGEATKSHDIKRKKINTTKIKKDEQLKKTIEIDKDQEMEEFKNEITEGLRKKKESTKTQNVELKKLETSQIKIDEQSKNYMIPVTNEDIEESTKKLVQILKGNNTEVNKIINQEEAIKLKDVEFEKLKMPEIKEDEQLKKMIQVKDQEIEECQGNLVQSFKENIDGGSKTMKSGEATEIQDIELQTFETSEIKKYGHLKKTMTFVKDQEIKSFKTKIIQNLKKRDAAATKIFQNIKVTKTQDIALIKLKSHEITEDERSKNTMAFIKDKEIGSIDDKIMQSLKNKKETDVNAEIGKIMKNGDANKSQEVELEKSKPHEIKEDEQSINKMALIKDREEESFKDEVIQSLKEKKETDVEVGKIIKKKDANKLQDVEFKKSETHEIKVDEQSTKIEAFVKYQEVEMLENKIMQRLKNVEVATIPGEVEATIIEVVNLKPFETHEIKENKQSKKTTVFVKDQEANVLNKEIMQNLKTKDDEAAKIFKNGETIKTQDISFKKLKSPEIKEDELSKNSMISEKDRKIEENSDDLVQILNENNDRVTKIIKKIEVIKPQHKKLKKCKSPEIEEDELLTPKIHGTHNEESVILIHNKNDIKHANDIKLIRESDAQNAKEIKNNPGKTKEIHQKPFIRAKIQESKFVSLKDLRKVSSESFGEFKQITAVETKSLSYYKSNEQYEPCIIPKACHDTETRITTSIDFKVSTNSDLDHTIDLSKIESPSKVLTDNRGNELTVSAVMLNANDASLCNDEGDQLIDIYINQSEIKT